MRLSIISFFFLSASLLAADKGSHDGGGHGDRGSRDSNTRGDNNAERAIETNPRPDAAAENLGSRAGAGPEDNDFVDPKVLRDFIQSRGLIECRQKCGSLTIAGDVRGRWQTATEDVDCGVLKRRKEENARREEKAKAEGKKANLLFIPNNFSLDTFKSEFNLFLDYNTKNSWVSTKTRWIVVDSIEPTFAVKTELDRAFMGYDIYNCGEEDFYIELGRTRFDYLFESRVEFSTLFNGIHVYYTNVYPRFGTVVIHGGPFVIHSFTDHYGLVGEGGVKDLIVKGFGFKYNIIDWYRHAPTANFGNAFDSNTRTVIDNPRYRFLVSQMLFSYEKKIDFLGCRTLYAYAAVLANHLAKKSRTTDWTYGNKAWYVGFTLGKLCKAGDWSLDVMYQSVGPQAVPEFDLAGIGHGNVLNDLLSDAILNNLPAEDAVGFTNYRGFQISALYALTDTFSFRSKLEWTRPYNPNIGGHFKYKAFEMSAIYAF